ncbi:hypothetical protein CRENBAI_007118 [Crenichthys baileyi]|uniref:Uncharacterized protein n=1 Tax=Crenichthys baileyi TaxID=28760 RepID=A0AAV9RSN6_9TELE
MVQSLNATRVDQAGYLGLTKIASLLFWMLTLEKALQTTWIIPGLPTLCFLLAGGYSDGALPGTTTDLHKRTLSTFPHNNITNRTSGLPQSEFKYLPAPFISACSSVVVSPPPGGSTSTS